MRFCGALLLFGALILEGFAQQPQWIWYPEGDPRGSVPENAVRFFRKTFELADGISAAQIHITADDHFDLLINGQHMLNDDREADGWQRLRALDVTRALDRGKNSLAIKARNRAASPAGLVAWLEVTLNNGQKIKIVTDGSWRASNRGESALRKWWERDYEDSDWVAALALGEVGKTEPWGDRVQRVKSPAERFQAREGFVVELVAQPSKDLGSLVCMTFDPKGRLTVSRENGPIQILEDADGDGKSETIKIFSDKVKNCQGLLWVGDALYANGQGPQGAGLYRLRDTTGDGGADQIECLGKYRGGMGEHGPHAIVLGPDQHLYIAVGNHAFAPPDKLAPDSPFHRYDEGELLRGYEDPNGHAVGIRAPGGTVLRVDLDGERWEQFAGGFRNHYDHAFNADGELFGYDSDMEWDVGLPWYRPTRVNHIISGGDYGWRSGTACMPEYFFDTLPTTVDIGRGSPTGVAFYYAHQFPEKYRGALFIADWSWGRIHAVFLKKRGATYTGTAEEFLSGKPLNVTDLEVGPDGCLYFTTGGRGTEGAVFRVRAEKNRGGRTTSRDESIPRATASSADAAYKTTAAAWKALSGQDPWVRYSARKTLERKPPSEWQAAVFSENNPRAALESLVALCRVSDDKTTLERIAEKCFALLSQKLGDDELLDLLRVIQIAHIKARGDRGDRSGGSYRPLAADAKIAAELSRRFPTSDWRINHELARLMVYLDAPQARDKILGELEKQRSLDASSPSKVNEVRRNQPRESQIHYAYCLGAARGGWTAEQKKRFGAWFEHASKWQGGHSFKGYLEYILADWEKTLSGEERAAVLSWRAQPLAKTVPPKRPATKPRPAAKLEFEEIAKFLEGSDGAKGSVAQGRRIYEERQCALCHKHGEVGQGGLGPDLTTVASRFKRRDLLEAIVFPSKIIADQYRSFNVKTKDGQTHSGLLARNDNQRVELIESSGEHIRFPKDSVEFVMPSDLSLMPTDLLDGLTLSDIADLFAFMESAP